MEASSPLSFPAPLPRQHGSTSDSLPRPLSFFLPTCLKPGTGAVRSSSKQAPQGRHVRPPCGPECGAGRGHELRVGLLRLAEGRQRLGTTGEKASCRVVIGFIPKRNNGRRVERRRYGGGGLVENSSFAGRSISQRLFQCLNRSGCLPFEAWRRRWDGAVAEWVLERGGGVDGIQSRRNTSGKRQRETACTVNSKRTKRYSPPRQAPPPPRGRSITDCFVG